MENIFIALRERNPPRRQLIFRQRKSRSPSPGWKNQPENRGRRRRQAHV
tara:strand:- start:424 stop:570 length:147 start_codon:yes stop_codon:yes gene_type:complete